MQFLQAGIDQGQFRGESEPGGQFAVWPQVGQAGQSGEMGDLGRAVWLKPQSQGNCGEPIRSNIHIRQADRPAAVEKRLTSGLLLNV